MMRWPIVIEYESGRSDNISTGPADVIAFERHFDKPATAVTTGRMEYFWWIAWHACKRLGKTELEFDAWADTVAMVRDGDAKEAEVLPLDLEAPTGS
jgi:hypothetical protein